ncbi:magnesium transporter CorA family protein [Nocardiopsis ansamitocini]|uniref:Magnesium transporter CorA n=1 Tax=Nocardiopsis ansamitocini TaxID=1670832 RepID=A0A9W6P207_9ACTN|nr:CorA family divalent cation transporter [Nocardiopsis ansamitocini]GLU45764.1 magnesium transporter CorA [Nocardiopsis ansamitocini]
MAQILLYRDQESTADPVPLSAVEHLADEDHPAWVGVTGEEQDLLEELSPALGLPQDQTVMAHAHRNRPWAWDDDGRFVFTVHVLLGGRQAPRFTTLTVFATKALLVTVGPDLSEALSDARPRHGVTDLMGTLLEWLTTGYQEMAMDIDSAIDDVEGMMFEEGRAEVALVQRRSYELRTRVLLLRRAVIPLSEILHGAAKGPGDPGRGVQRYREVSAQLDHTARLTESLRDMLISLLSTNLNIQQARLNVTMKKLTGWAAVIAIPTAVTSWYGMNVPLPWQSTLWGAALANCLVVGAAALVYFSFKRRDWL